MNILFKSLVVLFISLLGFSFNCFSQNNLTSDIQYQVNRVYPYISIKREKLKDAKTLKNLNPRYKTDWVKEYQSVEILTFQNGQRKSNTLTNASLTEAAIEMMNQADNGSDILVKVKYLPNNNLRQNDIHEMDFKFTIEPDRAAKYTGGEAQLKSYLKEKVINKLPANALENYDLAAVNFTINEEGEITNPTIFDSNYQTYDRPDVEKLLLNAVKEMPCWKPAAYANGKTTQQDFVLVVGNMKSCVVNLLNIYPAEKWSAE